MKNTTVSARKTEKEEERWRTYIDDRPEEEFDYGQRGLVLLVEQSVHDGVEASSLAKILHADQVMRRKRLSFLDEYAAGQMGCTFAFVGQSHTSQKERLRTGLMYTKSPCQESSLSFAGTTSFLAKYCCGVRHSAAMSASRRPPRNKRQSIGAGPDS